MMVRWSIGLVSVSLAAAATATVTANARQEAAADVMRAMGMGGLEGDALAKARAAAEAHPLGSANNPVRVDGPDGERGYLARLRCGDGDAPAFARRGSMGLGPFGNIVDLYVVRCRDRAPADVHMDMYHKQDTETRPVAGFTVAAADA